MDQTPKFGPDFALMQSWLRPTTDSESTSTLNGGVPEEMSKAAPAQLLHGSAEKALQGMASGPGSCCEFWFFQLFGSKPPADLSEMQLQLLSTMLLSFK